MESDMKEVYLIRLILVLTALSLLLFTYRLGYYKGRESNQKEWLEKPEGYCLGDVPNHPGECRNG